MIMVKNNSTTKKCFIIAAVAMVTLVACTKMEDTAPLRKITFETATYRPQTKADTVSIMSEFVNFKCKAFLHAAGYENETQMFFGTNGETISAYNGNNVVVTTSGSVAYWAPSHDYYWPKDPSSYINFVGWYDAKGTTPTTATEESLSWTGYVVEDNDNLLYADEAWHYNENPRSIYHKDIADGNTASYEGVPMLFHHALSKISVKALVTKTSEPNKTGSDEGTTIWDVTLSNFKIEGVYKQGDLVLTNEEPEPVAKTVGWTGSWTQQEGVTTDTLSRPNTTFSLTASASDIIPMRSVRPQDVTDDMVLSFDYNIDYYYQPDGGQASRYAREKISTSIPLSEFSGEIESWSMNKKITYTITINPETSVVRIDPAMVDWVTDSGSYPNQQ